MQTLTRTLLFSTVALGLTACTSTNCECDSTPQKTTQSATETTQKNSSEKKQQAAKGDKTTVKPKISKPKVSKKIPEKPSKKATAKNTNKNTKAVKPAPKSKGQPAPKALPGVYFARLPCPGCSSVRVNLVLEANNRYDKAEEYLSSNEIFFENGHWRFNKGRIELIPVTSSDTATESTMRYFRYDKGALTLLKADGKPYPGSQKDYRFKKKQ